MPEPLTNKEELKQMLKSFLEIDIYSNENGVVEVILSFDGESIDADSFCINREDT